MMTPHISFRRASTDPTLAAYLEQIADIPLLSKDEELRLGEAIQTGDQTALKRLVEANLRFVVKVAARYQGHGLSLADLIGEGNVGLLEAARRYSPEHNVRLITYAVWWVRQAMVQALARMGGVARFPFDKVRLTVRLRAAQAGLAQHLHREPSNEELLEGLDPSLLKLEELQQGGVVQSWSIDDSRGQERLSLALYRSNPGPPAEAELIMKSLRNEMEAVLQRLPAKEREVITMRYGFKDEEPLTLSEVGKHLRLTRERVRQIEEGAKRKLRTLARARHLTDYLGNRENRC